MIEATRPGSTIPLPVITGLVILAASILPIWFIDLSHAPTESQIRIGTTILVAIALFAVSRRITLMRWVLLVLLGTGIIVSVWSFIVAGTVEIQSSIITVAEAIGLALLFTPSANAWFAQPRATMPAA